MKTVSCLNEPPFPSSPSASFLCQGRMSPSQISSCRGTSWIWPVGMGGGQHELELHHAGVVLQLAVLDTVQLIGNVGSPNVHLGTQKLHLTGANNTPETSKALKTTQMPPNEQLNSNSARIYSLRIIPSPLTAASLSAFSHLKSSHKHHLYLKFHSIINVSAVKCQTPSISNSTQLSWILQGDSAQNKSKPQKN